MSTQKDRFHGLLLFPASNPIEDKTKRRGKRHLFVPVLYCGVSGQVRDEERVIASKYT